MPSNLPLMMQSIRKIKTGCNTWGPIRVNPKVESLPALKQEIPFPKGDTKSHKRFLLYHFLNKESKLSLKVVVYNYLLSFKKSSWRFMTPYLDEAGEFAKEINNLEPSENQNFDVMLLLWDKYYTLFINNAKNTNYTTKYAVLLYTMLYTWTTPDNIRFKYNKKNIHPRIVIESIRGSLLYLGGRITKKDITSHFTPLNLHSLLSQSVLIPIYYNVSSSFKVDDYNLLIDISLTNEFAEFLANIKSSLDIDSKIFDIWIKTYLARQFSVGNKKEVMVVFNEMIKAVREEVRDYIDRSIDQTYKHHAKLLLSNIATIEITTGGVRSGYELYSQAIINIIYLLWQQCLEHASYKNSSDQSYANLLYSFIYQWTLPKSLREFLHKNQCFDWYYILNNFISTAINELKGYSESIAAQSRQYSEVKSFEVKNDEIKSLEIKSLEIKSLEIESLEVKKHELGSRKIKSSKANRSQVSQSNFATLNARFTTMQKAAVNELQDQKKYQDATISKFLNIEEINTLYMESHNPFFLSVIGPLLRIHQSLSDKIKQCRDKISPQNFKFLIVLMKEVEILRAKDYQAYHQCLVKLLLSVSVDGINNLMENIFNQPPSQNSQMRFSQPVASNPQALLSPPNSNNLNDAINVIAKMVDLFCTTWGG